MFNKETYIQRRNRLKKEIGKGFYYFSATMKAV